MTCNNIFGNNVLPQDCIKIDFNDYIKIITTNLKYMNIQMVVQYITSMDSSWMNIK